MSSDSVVPTEEEAMDLLRDARAATGMSLRAAGDAFGKHANVIWNWEKGAGLDQLRYFMMLGRVSEAARFVILRSLGIPVAIMEEPEDRDLQRHLETMRRAYYRRDRSSVRSLLRALEEVLDENAPDQLRVADSPDDGPPASKRKKR